MANERGTRGFSLSLWEVLLCCGFVALLTWSGLTARLNEALTNDPEVEAYRLRYGPAKHSTGPEEWLIRDFFKDRREGMFLDVGAGDYERDSNTYYLEKSLGWRGVAVDALSKFADGYAKNRPATKFFAFFVSNRSGDRATLYVNPLNSELSSVSREGPASRGPTFEREVPTISLNDLLDTLHVTHVDFVSMDIELAEPAALAGFDIQRFAPSLVCVESHLQVRQQILDYFASNGYAIVGPYLRADRSNLYFTPLRGQRTQAAR